jgi:DNA modification methylase
MSTRKNSSDLDDTFANHAGLADGGRITPINPADRQHPIAAVEGVQPYIRQKTRRRRERLRALAEITRHAGPPRNDQRPKLQICSIAIGQLKPARRRVRRSTPEQVARIRAALLRFGQCVPVIVDRDLHIVDGHSVVEAARSLSFDEINVVVLEHLAPGELRLLSITLNRLAETGQWDGEALAMEFEELIALDEDVLVTGFDTVEIDNLIHLQEDSDATQHAIPEIQPFPVSQSGDLWLLGPHRLLQGDARAPASHRRLMNDGEQARILLTDEPFNVPNGGHVTSRTDVREFAMAAGEMSPDQFATFNRAWLEAALPFVIDGGLIGTFIDWRSVEIVLATGRELGLSLLNLIVWAKSNGGQGSLWRSQHELLPMFKKGKSPHLNHVELGRFGRWRSNLWQYAGASSLGSDARDHLSLHPTVKPVAMLEDALLDISDRGEIVLDPFAGSGSTLMAAEGTGRCCRAIEIDSLYCDVVIRRWQHASGQEAILERTGEPFARIEASVAGEPR